MVIQNIRTADFIGATYAKVMIKVGDKVTWESQARGSWVEKRGTVVAVVPPGESALGWVPLGTKKSHIKFEADIYLRGGPGGGGGPGGSLRWAGA